MQNGVGKKTQISDFSGVGKKLSEGEEQNGQ